MSQTAIAVNGSGLNCDVVTAVARDGAFVTVTPQAVENARQAWEVVREVAARRPVYGRTTGVGANRDVTIEDDDAHGLRLLRSHSGGAGPLMSAENVRAMLVVRLNQIAAGGSGVDPDVLGALTDVINRWLIPPIPAYGAIGTGDLTALASTALCLIGERPWQGGASTARFPLRPADAPQVVQIISPPWSTIEMSPQEGQTSAAPMRAAPVSLALRGPRGRNTRLSGVEPREKPLEMYLTAGRGSSAAPRPRPSALNSSGSALARSWRSRYDTPSSRKM